MDRRSMVGIVLVLDFLLFALIVTLAPSKWFLGWYALKNAACYLTLMFIANAKTQCPPLPLSWRLIINASALLIVLR
jgi:hypothetical protein